MSGLEQIAAGLGAACIGGLGSLPLESAAQQSADRAAIAQSGHLVSAIARAWRHMGTKGSRMAGNRTATTCPPPFLRPSSSIAGQPCGIGLCSFCIQMHQRPYYMATGNAAVAAANIRGELDPCCSRTRPREVRSYYTCWYGAQCFHTRIVLRTFLCSVCSMDRHPTCLR